MGRVYTIPSDNNFVAVLAEGLWSMAGGDPLTLAGMLVLLPTRRACRELRGAFVTVSGGRAALLPRLQPMGDVDETELYFTATAFPDIPPAIPPLRRQMLLTQLVLKKDDTLPLEQAAQLATALANLLDQVQIEQKDFSGLPDLVADQTPQVAAHWQQTLEFLEIVTQQWPVLLAAEGCIDPADRRNRVIAAQIAAWAENSPDYPVIAAGSTGSMPAVAAWLAAITAQPQGMIVLPGLDQGSDEAVWQAVTEGHPQHGMKCWLEKHVKLPREAVAVWPATKALRRERVRLLNESVRPAAVAEGWQELGAAQISAEALRGVTRLDLAQEQEEAAVIALRLRAVLETPDKKAVLVTPDRGLAERVAAALRRWGIMANDSAGVALTSLPVGSFLRDVLLAAVPNAGAVEYLSLLKHPLAAAGLAPTTCRELARLTELAAWRGYARRGGWRAAARAVRENAAKIGNADAEGLAAWLEKIAVCFDKLTASWCERRPLTEWIAAHLTLAEHIAASDDRTGAERLWRDAAGEAAVLWFDEWRQAAAGFPPLTGSDYLRLCSGLMRSVTVRPIYRQHGRLSILGLLEARLIQADLVILGGLNEGNWPPQAPIDPWLSRPMKQKLELPLPEWRIGLAGHDFVQLASAPEVMLTRARRAGTSPTVPSRFLLQLEAVLQALGYQQGDENALAPAEPWAEWARAMDEPAAVTPCARPSPRPPVATRPNNLSVTEIGLWQRNPYAIYARHILKLSPLDPIALDVAAAERGTMVHAALEAFLAKYKDRLPDEPMEALLTLGREAFKTFADQPQVAAFWWPRFLQTAQWFVAQEIERRRSGIKTLAVEAGGKILLADGDFTLRGRADRIDMLPGGGIEIIDYKTGIVPSDKMIERGLEPQLPLLALMVEAGGLRGVDAAAVAKLSYWSLQGDAEGEAMREVKNLQPVMQAALAGLEALLAKFADPATPYEAVPKLRFAPRYDHYGHLARLTEWGREAEGEA